MKNKTTKFLRRIYIIILTVVICLGNFVPVFAIGSHIEGTETNPAGAAITKKLTMPEGTTTPNATFAFEFTKVCVDDIDATTNSTTMPEIGPVEISFSDTDEGTTADSVKTVIMQSENVISGISFPHAGVYVYNVAERKPYVGYEINNNETYSFSNALYTITFYVKNGSSNNLYVAAVASKITVADNESQEVGKKVNPSPGTDGDYSKMIFTNTYSKTGGGTNPTDQNNHMLTVSKTVVGDYADQTKYFTFNVTVANPSLVNSAVYKAYVVNSTNNSVDISKDNLVSDNPENDFNNLDQENGYKYFKFEAGAPMSIKLKHNQKLVFTDLHIGSSYVAVESDVGHYNTKINLLVNGESQPVIEGLSTDVKLIGEKINSAAFTNTYQTIIPGGVVINNLPFILILLLAVGSLVGFIVVKTRKHNRYVSGY